MKYSISLLFILSFFFVACDEAQKESNISLEKIYAWCIVPFDSLERTAEERIDLLQKLGIKKYAYDWREKHLPTMAHELRLAKKSGIDVISVWMWIDDNNDTIDSLSEANETVFSVIDEVAYEGQIWVSFNNNYFKNLSQEQAVYKGARMIEYLSKRAAALQCKVALYNHGDWFGEPQNQIEIIEALPNEELGLIYNFHHAHLQVDRFPYLVKIMSPYIWSINLNGMKIKGPKILAIGEGDHELDMIEVLINNGYQGDYGILGHVEDEDLEKVLLANLKGVQAIFNLH